VDGAEHEVGHADADRPLSEAEIVGWFNLLNAHTHLTRQLDAQLQERHDISLAEHTVLRQLILVGGHLRMSELATRFCSARAARRASWTAWSRTA